MRLHRDTRSLLKALVTTVGSMVGGSEGWMLLAMDVVLAIDSIDYVHRIGN